jgi:methanogenic corrinoid protein MtbC1
MSRAQLPNIPLIMADQQKADALAGNKFDITAGEKKGKVIIGTVKGDIHDIGKDLVVSLLKANGYNVIDLGVDVPAEEFVEAVQSSGVRVVGLSGRILRRSRPSRG